MNTLDIIKESIDLDGVGRVEITWDFDEDGYKEWISDNEIENNQESLYEYIRYYVEFDIEYFDNETYHHMGYATASYEELESELGERMTERVIVELIEKGESSFETEEVYNSESFDVNNPDELNRIAIKILNHGEYYKGCRGYILTNGVIVYTGAEHNMVTQIDGIKDKYDFIRMGNIRILDQSIDLSKEPTSEQREVLRNVIASYSDEELYLDIFLPDGGVVSAHYTHPYWRFVMGEIDRFFRDGIRPQGNRVNESVDGTTTDVRFDGEPDHMGLEINGKEVARYSYKDSTAYPFIIYDGNLYIGGKGETHGFITQGESWVVANCKKAVYGRIWVKAKVNEFNHSVVAFWGMESGSENCKQYVYEVAKRLNVNPSKIVVVVDHNGELTWEQLTDWNGFVHIASNAENEKRNLHMMDAKEKHDNTGDFRTSRDKKIGKKLTGDSGKEMSMAQYHNMIYQESKKVIVSESQYDRLFRKNSTEIKISEGQYNRLFRKPK